MFFDNGDEKDQMKLKVCDAERNQFGEKKKNKNYSYHFILLIFFSI